ncbi:hypothetical protein FAZ15_03245 [Sphingobacterium olei]|uniref:Pycsar effector protein domain-containing protein n=1 Tax=Sphingobacterium olei TaxID=2571155 RepID=A0A4U0P7G3_9SPHI|nr:Pycsar system effector family protein [Sphingobacterium olei]TJZ63309.1 hypothetical protein FAZ15_03245 [Sphingobacterium olei]
MEKDRLKFSIERFDHYYDSVNNKSAVFLGLSTFVVGGLVAAYPSLLQLVDCGIFVHILMLCTIGLGLAIMIVVIVASTPFLATDGNSIHFFGSISKMSREEYCEQSSLPNLEEDELHDLRVQVYQLSCGLTDKFNKLKRAGRLFTIQFFLFIPLILLIIFNLR